MTERKWVFALSIDDELAWALAPVNPDPSATWDEAFPVKAFPHGRIDDLPNRDCGSDGALYPLQQRIMEALSAIESNYSAHMRKVRAVGVSSIGLVDKTAGRLVSIARKPWQSQDAEYVLDFPSLFRGTLDQVLKLGKHGYQIAAQNDATAKCLAHRTSLDGQMSSRDLLCTVMLNDGINIGAANGDGPISPVQLHPELGHGYPRLSKLDEQVPWDNRIKHFSSKTGCPNHVLCYEGLTSSVRIMKEWGADKIKDIADDGKRSIAGETVSYYIAQLCWTVTLGLVPSQIFLCGKSACDTLVELVRENFRQLNDGYLNNRAYEALNKPDFIKLGRIFEDFEWRTDVKNREALMGALELARRAAWTGKMPQDVTPRRRWVDLVQDIGSISGP